MQMRHEQVKPTPVTTVYTMSPKALRNSNSKTTTSHVLNRALWGSSHPALTKTHPPLSPHPLTLLSTSPSFSSIQPSAPPVTSGASPLNSFANLSPLSLVITLFFPILSQYHLSLSSSSSGPHESKSVSWQLRLSILVSASEGAVRSHPKSRTQLQL